MSPTPNTLHSYVDKTGVSHVCQEVETSELLCVVDGHSKFWTGTLCKSTTETNTYLVFLHWGRIGSTGTTPAYKKFPAYYKARRYLSGRIQDKMNKGYVVSTLELLAAAEAENGPKVRDKHTVVESTEFEWDL